MPTMIRGRGACPACNQEVHRMIANLRGRMRETYTCPEHGVFAYGAVEGTVAAWSEKHPTPAAPEGGASPWAKALETAGIVFVNAA